jgi:hypothetical protein
MERAKAEIEAQEMEDLYASESDSEDDRGKNDGGKD